MALRAKAIETPTEKRLFTLEEYKRMIEAGVFNEDEHVELIRGEIVKMAPISDSHVGAVLRLTMLFGKEVGDEALVSVQNPVQFANNTRPEPDLALLKWHDYGASRPVTAADVLLVVEVAETSARYDREVKGPLYAEAGIPEYWIVNLRDQVVEVYRTPTKDAYQDASKAKRGEALALPANLGALPLPAHTEHQTFQRVFYY